MLIGADRFEDHTSAAIRCLAVSTSSRLAAENFSSPFQIVIVLLNLFTHSQNSAAGSRVQPEHDDPGLPR